MESVSVSESSIHSFVHASAPGLWCLVALCLKCQVTMPDNVDVDGDDDDDATFIGIGVTLSLSLWLLLALPVARWLLLPMPPPLLFACLAGLSLAVLT